MCAEQQCISEMHFIRVVNNSGIRKTKHANFMNVVSSECPYFMNIVQSQQANFMNVVQSNYQYFMNVVQSNYPYFMNGVQSQQAIFMNVVQSEQPYCMNIVQSLLNTLICGIVTLKTCICVIRRISVSFLAIVSSIVLSIVLGNRIRSRSCTEDSDNNHPISSFVYIQSGRQQIGTECKQKSWLGDYCRYPPYNSVTLFDSPKLYSKLCQKLWLETIQKYV